MGEKIDVCILFDREDLAFLKDLRKHLRILETEGLAAIWDTSEIPPGWDWRQVIQSHLETASVILLLVSANFMGSDEGYKLAMRAFDRNAPPDVHVVPVLLSDYGWQYSKLGSLNPLPTNKKPISRWPHRSTAYEDIVQGLREIITEIQSPGASPQPATHAQIAQEKIQASEPVHAPVDADQLNYVLEEQPWYAPRFPQAEEIDQEQIDALKAEIDVVIMTATDVELRAVMHLLEPYPGQEQVLLAFVGPETYYLGKFGAYRAVVTKCRMGSISEGSAAFAALQAQNVWRPKALIMVGIAFGKDAARQKIADVLVASQIISYEQQRLGEQVVFRGAIPPSNTILLNRFENALNWRFIRPDGKECALLIGPILSGEKLVDDPAFKRQLFQQFPQAIGGEMEGAGLCAASGRVGVAWILVKAICDWGDGTKHKRHQPLAAAAAVSLVHHVLSYKRALDSINKP